MEAPDKLYLSPVIYGAVTNLSPNPDCEGEVEYIRKDAILERIKERLKLYDPDDPEAETTCYELQSIISWLNGKEERK